VREIIARRLGDSNDPSTRIERTRIEPRSVSVAAARAPDRAEAIVHDARERVDINSVGTMIPLANEHLPRVLRIESMAAHVRVHDLSVRRSRPMSARDGDGLTALVTGASAGIGKAFAEVFARNGFDVILTARRKERLESLARALATDHRVKAHVIAADLADPSTPAALASRIDANGWRVDALVNNAGYGVPGAYRATAWNAQRDFVQVLVTAPCELAHRFLPGMIARRRGYVVNIASVAGLIPGAAGHTLYGASKSFLIQFSRSLHLEQEGSGVHVTAVCPGFTHSEFHDVTGTREQVSKMPGFMWMSAETVAEQGYAAVMCNRAVYVNGWFNEGVVFLAKHLPDFVTFAIARAGSKSFRAQ
jgi:short-subunit dehydrogenase